MKKILITGITGFVGSHLADYLLTKSDVEIYGTKRWRSNLENIEHIKVKDKINLVECSLADFNSVLHMIKTVKPDIIFHLAAQSFVKSSWESPRDTFDSNIIGQLNLFDAIRKIGINPIIQIAGSSEEYGTVFENEVPITENNPLRPLSPYAVSKVTQDLLGYQYFKSYGMQIIRTRAFNHTGPRRGEVFVTSNFAKQLAMMEKGKQESIIKVGNLEAYRDFTDVRDIVKAYVLSTERCIPGEVYNISSQKQVQIREVLDILRSFITMDIKVEQDESRMRPSDVSVLWGDSSKFRNLTGWNNEIPFEKTMLDLLNYWRIKVK